MQGVVTLDQGSFNMRGNSQRYYNKEKDTVIIIERSCQSIWKHGRYIKQNTEQQKT